MSTERPLILFTNDDGIASPGLWTAARAFEDVADVLIVAPMQQQSGTGRSLPNSNTGAVIAQQGKEFNAFSVDGTPAQAVQHAIMEVADRQPSLVVSGINYGENTGNGVTISGTVGAALEAASFDIPAIAVSQQTDHNLHLTHSQQVDFTVAAHFTRQFALRWLDGDMPDDVDILKLDLPAAATLDTPWRLTRLSKSRVYWPTVPDRTTSWSPQSLGYAMQLDESKVEPDSDVYAVFIDEVISLTPMSLDMTSRLDMETFDAALREQDTASSSA